jgi:hypothetical protein
VKEETTHIPAQPAREKPAFVKDMLFEARVQPLMDQQQYLMEQQRIHRYTQRGEEATAQLRDLQKRITSEYNELEKPLPPTKARTISQTKYSSNGKQNITNLTSLKTYLGKNELWDVFGESFETGQTDTLFGTQQKLAEQNEQLIQKRFDTLLKKYRYIARPRNSAQETLDSYKQAFNLLKKENDQRNFLQKGVSSVRYLQGRNYTIYAGLVSLTNEGISYSSQDD